MTIDPLELHKFLEESNHIERIDKVLWVEIMEATRFLNLETISIADLVSYVRVIQPDAVLRDRDGLDVIVGDHQPPAGGPDVLLVLGSLLSQINDDEVFPYRAHLRYEALHPFTDGNGRSGRLLWLWQMKSAPLGFLHTFYYQTLSFYDEWHSA